MTKRNMVWAPSNGFSDDPYEEERMAKRFSGQKDKKEMKKKRNVNIRKWLTGEKCMPITLEEWLAIGKRGESIEVSFNLPWFFESLPCGCKRGRMPIHGSNYGDWQGRPPTGPYIIGYRPGKLYIERKKDRRWYCEKCVKCIV